eukprot:4041706-Pyramimonas_sp.AAC.2
MGEQWEKVGNWTQCEKRGRVYGVLCASLPLVAQEDPCEAGSFIDMRREEWVGEVNSQVTRWLHKY